MKKTVKLKRKTPGESGEPRTQYGALPWRMEEEPEVMLLTSRDTRRWVIPKGWPMKGRKPNVAAALEALQEGGLLGKIGKKALGSYHYRKRLKNGAALWCRVEVFPLRVLRQRKNWREKEQRVTHWFPYAEAAEHVAEEELKELILTFGDTLSALANGDTEIVTR
ncbi:MAG TPA: NUDIX hydrolase [Methylocystis sp.]|nr:NUDIX hydrolase [Methylocystis sp.]